MLQSFIQRISLCLTMLFRLIRDDDGDDYDGAGTWTWNWTCYRVALY